MSNINLIIEERAASIGNSWSAASCLSAKKEWLDHLFLLITWDRPSAHRSFYTDLPL